MHKRLVIAFLLTGSVFAADLALIPYPRSVTLREGRLRIGPTVSISSANADDHFAATTLANDLESVDDIHAILARNAPAAKIVLARDDSAVGRQALARAGIKLPAAAQDEGYVLLVTPAQAIVVGRTATGVFYGAQTLRQLFHPAVSSRHAEAPAVLISDWPALRYRGVHHDISRGPVPTLTSMKRNIELLSEFKQNVYSLYFENTFGYQTLPLVGAFGGSITAPEARELVEFARRYHVDIIPEQEAFGHMHLALQYEKFQDMAEVPYGHVLSPAVPQSLEFIRSMFAELAPLFPSQYLHIGADETFELGEGRTRPMVESQGEGAVYINYLRQIDEILKPYHRKVMFWGDIAGRHPELLRDLPHDMVAIPWEYSPRPAFTPLIKPFADVGLETWVAPGCNNWNRFFPDYNLALPNIRGFVSDGKRLGATGMLNTTWMDDGEALFNSAWYGIAYGAAQSWEENVDDARFKSAYDWTFYRADQHNFNGEVEKLTSAHQAMRDATHQDAQNWMTWLNPFDSRGFDFYQHLEPAAHQVRLLAEDVMADLAVNRSLARRNADLLDYVDFGARRMDLLGQKAIYAKYMSELYSDAQAAAPTGKTPDGRTVAGLLRRISGVNGLAEDLRDATSALRNRYRDLWLAENRPYYLDNILARYDAELLLWNSVERRYDNIRSEYRTTKSLPPFLTDERIGTASREQSTPPAPTQPQSTKPQPPSPSPH